MKTNETNGIANMVKVYHLKQNGEIAATYMSEIRAKNEAIEAINEGEQGITVEEDFAPIAEINKAFKAALNKQ